MKTRSILISLLSLALGLSACEKPNPAEQDKLVLDRNQLQFEASSARAQSLELKANRAWEASCEENWVTISPASGTGDAVLSISVEDNVAEPGKAAAARSARIVFKAGEASAEVQISQSAETIVFAVDGKAELTAAGGTVVVKVDYNSSYTVDIPVDWISRVDSKAVASETLNFAVAANESADERSAEISFTPQGGTAQSVLVRQEGQTQKGIYTASDFMAFAEAVNSNASLDRFCNEAGEVVLMADIDLKGCTLVPVGKPESVANANSSYEYSGASFKGVFNGQGHCLYNITADVKLEDASVWGIFGVLDGGTVKNLVLGKEGDESLVKISAKSQADAAILVGAAYNGAVVENCVNNVPLEMLGTETENRRFACGVFVGYACSSDNSVCLTSLVNNAAIKADAGANTKNGATGAMVGGIAAFCTGAGTGTTTVESCENKADITACCGRSSGIVATMNAKTMMRYCVNRGNQVNSFVNGRIANLTCIMGGGCSMDDCTNYGNVTTSDAATTTAGMVGLLNSDNVVLSGGGNYGTVIGANEKYHGLLCANFSKFASVKGCYAGGACGTYASDGNHIMHELTADTWLSHIGYYSETNFAKISELSSPWGTGGSVEADLPEMKDASLRILFIGNSFTKDAVEHLPGMIAAAGLKDITLAHCYYGGRTIPEYYRDRETANNTLYYANPGDSKWSTAAQKASIKKVAESGRWDIVTIQEHTGNYLAWSWTDEEKTAISNLVEYVCGTQSSRPKVGYIFSQAYFNMDKIASASKPYISWTDQAGMYEVIVAQARKVQAESPVDEILATGTMLQNLRSSELDNEMNLTRDGYHMDYGISRYGASCLLFESLITPKFSVTLDGNSYRSFEESTADGSYRTPITDANAPVALQAARYAIEKPFEVTSMEGVGPVTPEITLKGSGAASDPYLISAAEDMRQIGIALVEGETRYFSLTGDIDMSSISNWAPVNTDNLPKNIDFEGNNHTISGFSCSNANYASIFGLISGSVRNLRIDGASVSNTGQCGILAVWLGNNGNSADNILSATVENVHITNATLSMAGTSNSSAGMIAANAGSSTIRNCSASGVISHSCTKANWSYVGGIVGRCYASSSIDRCFFNGELKGSGANGFGGICGGTGKDTAVYISNCWSDGSISGASYCGGIVSDLCTGSRVSNCYSLMTLEGVYNLGGIAARTSNAANPNSTGTFSTDWDIKVSGCIAWNPSITSTKAATETPASHYSSGAVVGFTNYVCELKQCYRRPDINFNMYSIEAYNTLTDTPDTSVDAPLVKPGEETFLCPYNGKAAGATDTVSSLARTLSWDEGIWDLSGDYPVLK